MFLNWSIEAYKWKLITKKIEKINLKTALISVFSGITVGIFTPNRIGEPGGRIVVLKKNNRSKGISGSFLGSLSQTIITFSLGLISILLIIFNSKNEILSSNYFNIIFFCAVLFTLILLFSFLNIKFFIKKISKFKIFKKIEKHIVFLEEYKKTELVEIIIHSFFRYLVYLVQYYLLICFFGVEISFFNALISVSAIFLIISLIPSVVLADLGIRGSVALFIFGIFTNSDIGILASSSTLWIINIVIPAIIGSFFFYKTKF